MENIVWDEKYNIGLEVVDKAHAKLFRVIKKLLEISQDGENNQHVYKEGVKYLETYSMTHFSEEEAYMRSIRYQGYAEHKRIHDNFRDKTLVAMKRDLELSNYSYAAIQRLVGTMGRWLAEHIMQEDQAIVGKGAARKSYDFSAQIPLISKTVNRAMSSLFQSEAKLVSANYKGQNFGEGYYSRHQYDIEGGIRLQMLLGVEEQLLLKGIGVMQGCQVVKKEEIGKEEVLRIFEQLFQEMSKLFRVETEQEFTMENLLTRDEFRTAYMKGYPCSLLYSTKVGYFTFSYRSWRIRSNGASGGAGKKEGV